MRKYKFLSVFLVLALMVNLTSCAEFKYDTFKCYSEILEDAYKDKDDIDPEDKGVYMKTVAGFLKCLDDRDEDGMEGFLCDRLESMDDTSDKIKALSDGFEGDIKDTTGIATDLSARKFGQWSKTESVTFYDDEFILFTTEQTYWVSISMYSVCGDRSDGDDFVGITNIRIMTLDMRYGMERETDQTDDEENYTDRYTFIDGSSAENEITDSCGILAVYGDSSDYIAVNTAKGTFYEVFKLTGSEDEIDEDILEDIGSETEEELYETFMEYEPYAVGEPSSVSNIISHKWIYSIEGSSDKLLVDFFGDETDGVKITYIRRMDISEPIDDRNSTMIYDD